jgi:hypothetical protein
VKLEAFANRIATQGRLRHLTFLAAAVFSVMIIGYHFGTFDQCIHIPFLKAGVNPALYPGDPFIALRGSQPSFFWYAFWPFYRWGGLEVVIFTVHLLASYLTFWALWDLSLTLFETPLASLFGVAAFLIPHFGFLGLPVIEFSLLNRTFVLPFLLFGISLFIRKRYLAAFLLLGLVANLHALSANLAMGMLLLTGLLEYRRAAISKVFQWTGVYLLAAAPLLIMQASRGQGLDWSLRPEWMSAISRGGLAQLFYPFAPAPFILALTFSGFCAMAIFLIARRAYPSPHHEKTLSRMFVAALAIFTVGVLTAWVLPVTILIQSQLTRVSLFILIFTCLHFANYLACEYHFQRMPPASFLLQAGVFLVSIFFIFPLLVFGWLRWLKPASLKWGWVAAAIVGSFGFGVGLGFTWQVYQPGFNIFGPRTAWVDAQRWAREHTPLQAVFITPPEKGGLFDPEWRVFSERSDLASLYELFEIAITPQYLPIWQARFNALAPGAMDRSDYNYFDAVRFARQAFYSLTDQDLLQVACTFQAGYLVSEKPHTRPFQQLYENQGYIIYNLPTPAKCAPALPSQ